MDTPLMQEPEEVFQQEQKDAGNPAMQALAEKMQAKAEGREIEKAKPDPIAPLVRMLDNLEPQFRRALAGHLNSDAFVRMAITTIRNSPKLWKSDQLSLVGALMTAAQLRLPLDPVMGQAYLVPFWSGRAQKYMVQLIIGYKGYADLMYRSSQIADVMVGTVHENDEFDYELGTNARILHKPARGGKSVRGEAIAYYAIARTVHGGSAFKVMWKEEVEEHRDRFVQAENRKEGRPWHDHFDAMAMKTCLRMLTNLMPLSTEIQTAIIAADERVHIWNPMTELVDDEDVIDVEAELTPEPEEGDAHAEQTDGGEAKELPEATEEEKPKKRTKRSTQP